MPKLKVFISHSCKDAETAGPEPTDAEKYARYQRLKYAQKVREEIRARLAPDAFEVLLDVERLEPGEGWRAKLHFWLQSCDAAVILLSPEAVASTWVRKEANILLHRRALSGKLTVIPVFLGDFETAALREAGFDDVEVLEPQAARVLDRTLNEANAGELAKVVVERLLAREPVTMDAALMRWIENVVTALKKSDEPQLERARIKAGVGDVDWAINERRLELFAHLLLQVSLPTVVEAIALLSDGILQRDYLRRLTSLLLPVWVDEGAATKLLAHSAATADSGARIARFVAINGEDEETGRDYLNRAWCFPGWQGRVVTFNPPAGEDQDKELRPKLHKLIMAKLAVAERLMKARLEGEPFFVVLGTNVPLSPPFLQDLADKYEPARFIVMAGRDFERLGAEHDHVARVQPRLGPGAEDEAVVLKARVRNDYQEG